MNNAIIHRGPDDEGYFESDFLHLGMRRLSIIDLSGGSQPIYNEDKSVVIVFNGEIYNYQILQEQLKKRGHRFRTNTDTETIIHLYEEKGIGCVEDLQGMFAFAVYDLQEKKLYLARDRLGKKPLYFSVQNDTLYGASELKSILAVAPGPYSLNSAALSAYFSLTFIPAPHTIYQGIYKLEPGSFLTIDSNLSIEKKCYWDLGEIINRQEQITSYEECKVKLRETIADSVKGRMIADTPLGAFLSGGVDSSILVAVMAELSPKPVQTFSVVNEQKNYDESHKARTVARIFKTEHNELCASSQLMSETAEEALLAFDEPFADSSALPSFIISKLARQHVKVVLTGDGGDELFGGYTRYNIFSLIKNYQLIPGPIRRGIISPIVNMLPNRAGPVSHLGRLKKLVNANVNSPFESYFSLQQLGFQFECHDTLLNGNSDSFIRYESKRIFDQLQRAGSIQRAMFTDVKIGLEGDMLAKIDRMSMLASIETRSPLLDYRLAELSFRIPLEFKIQGRRLKAILKDTYSSLFPRGFLDKPKMGFGIPVGQLLRTVFWSRLNSVVNSEIVKSIGNINIEFVKRLIGEHNSGLDRTFQLWTVFVYCLWLQKNETHVKF